MSKPGQILECGWMTSGPLFYRIRRRKLGKNTWVAQIHGGTRERGEICLITHCPKHSVRKKIRAKAFHLKSHYKICARSSCWTAWGRSAQERLWTCFWPHSDPWSRILNAFLQHKKHICWCENVTASHIKSSRRLRKYRRFVDIQHFRLQSLALLIFDDVSSWALQTAYPKHLRVFQRASRRWNLQSFRARFLTWRGASHRG